MADREVNPRGGSTQRSTLRILLGIADVIADRLSCEIKRVSPLPSIVVVPTFQELQKQAVEGAAVILIEYHFLYDLPLVESLYNLSCTGPVILVAPVELQSEIATLVASGNVDFVARLGDFIPLAASLIERRLSKQFPASTQRTRVDSFFSKDIGEIFRHEINNPLTGILGNAELVLVHRDRLPAGDAQRLQTVVDLAVRLRETIRRLSDCCEIQSSSAKSA